MITITTFGPRPPKPTDETIFYPWIIVRENAGIFGLILLLAAILGSVFYGLKKKSIVLALLMAVVTSVIGLSTIEPYVGRIMPALVPDPDHPIIHIDAIRANGYVYNLVKFPEAFNLVYILYECDRLGINCHVLYRYKPNSLDDVYVDRDNPPFISSDNTNISLHIAGKVVYTLPASPNA